MLLPFIPAESERRCRPHVHPLYRAEIVLVGEPTEAESREAQRVRESPTFDRVLALVGQPLYPFDLFGDYPPFIYEALRNDRHRSREISQHSALPDFEEEGDPNDLPPAPPRTSVKREAVEEPLAAQRELSPYQGIDYARVVEEGRISPLDLAQGSRPVEARPAKRRKIATRKTVVRLKPGDDERITTKVLRPRHTLHKPERYQG